MLLVCLPCDGDCFRGPQLLEVALEEVVPIAGGKPRFMSDSFASHGLRLCSYVFHVLSLEFLLFLLFGWVWHQREISSCRGLYTPSFARVAGRGVSPSLSLPF